MKNETQYIEFYSGTNQQACASDGTLDFKQSIQGKGGYSL